MNELVTELRTNFNKHKSKSISWRKEQLKQLSKLIEENHKDICDVLKKDLNKAEQEVVLGELNIIKGAIAYGLTYLNNYQNVQYVSPGMPISLAYTACIQYQPYGVALIIGAWNYPFLLCLTPLVGAIASGNCVLLKPSELSENSAALIEILVNKYLDNECIKVFNGGVNETIELLKERFDFIMYTGSTAVGKSIMQSAVKHMTPVLLECGGKSPTYIDESADLNLTARCIVWGKFANSGQTCVAPDYILCTKEVEEKLIPIVKNVLLEFFGEKPELSDSYGRIVNNRHFKRIQNLIDKSKVIHGGTSIEELNFIHPTIMTNVNENDKVMQEEIFGPVLPFKTVKNYEEAIDFINSREKPLALYVFAKNDKIYEEFLEKTSSGSFGYNDVCVQVTVESLPFGGVGESGLGRYHGKYSIEAFSHCRAILKSGRLGDTLVGFRYPPYTPSKLYQAKLTGNSMMETLSNSCSIL